MAAPALLIAASLALQLGQASVQGRITDARTGEPIAGVVVILPDLQRAVIADAAGAYALRAVPPGPQHVTIRRLGYEERTLHAFVPRTGTLRLDVALNAQPIEIAGLEVRPLPAVRGLETEVAPSADDVLTLAALRNHPLLAEPDALRGLSGGVIYVRPETAGGLHIRGGESHHTSYLLDDLPVLNPYHGAGISGSWNPDILSHVEVFTTLPASALPDALSGAVIGRTRAPSVTHGASGSVSTTQARIAVYGPLGHGAGYLFGIRTGFPDVFAPHGEGSYVRGESGDAFIKATAPLLGGTVTSRFYESENELSALAVANSSDASVGRNQFEWTSQSTGLSWERPFAGKRLRTSLWDARTVAAVRWGGEPMWSGRRDVGAAAEVSSAAWTYGLRWTRIATRYETPGLRMRQHLPIAAAHADHHDEISRAVSWSAGTTLEVAQGGWRLSPRAQLRYQSSNEFRVTAAYARTRQYVQSLRSPESVASHLFPADLFIASVDPVPVSRADQLVLLADLTPRPGLRLRGQLYRRWLHQLMLPALGSTRPFAAQQPDVGSGSAAGLAFDGAYATKGYALVAAWHLQSVTMQAESADYTPQQGIRHLVDAGVTLFPTSTLVLKAGVSAGAGRPATPLVGDLEWESCNLLDGGCEFGGTPSQATDELGQAALPSYVRLDLGIRKHWHLSVRGRDVAPAAFASITNVFGHRNVLAVGESAVGGVTVTMRPRALLLLGLDWRY